MTSKINCPKCEKTFRTESGFLWHLQRMHSKARQDDGEVEANQTAQDTIQELEARLDRYGETISELANRLRFLSVLQEQISEAEARLGKLENQVEAHLDSHRREESRRLQRVNICTIQPSYCHSLRR